MNLRLRHALEPIDSGPEMSPPVTAGETGDLELIWNEEAGAFTEAPGPPLPPHPNVGSALVESAPSSSIVASNDMSSEDDEVTSPDVVTSPDEVVMLSLIHI